jgi:polysaccharide export outer membrane protein/exopolysaccharide production protein ExoF
MHTYRHRSVDRRTSSAAIALTCLVLAGWFVALWQSGGVRAQNARVQGPLTGSEYMLGPQDKVRVKVFAWRPSRDEVYEWKALNDVYTVGPSGLISMPLIGEVPAGGASLSDLSDAIGEQLKSSLGLIDAPRASVEIVEFRPFYILGTVQRPGEYPFRPGLTIIQALSIGGGLLRFNEFEAVRLDRETIATNGERRVIESEINSLLAKRARLDAEVNGDTAVKFPASLYNQSGNPGLGPLLDEEERIFNTRLSAFETRARELERSKLMLQNQLAVIEGYLADQDAHIHIAVQEVKLIDDLFARKLTTTSRRAEAARNLRQVEGERIRLQTTSISVRQDYSRVEMEAQALRDARMTETVSGLRTTQARLDELTRRLRTAETLVHEAKVAAPYLATLGVRKVLPDYTIIRQNGGTQVTLSATETTLLHPGDTIKVELPFRDGSFAGPSETTGEPREKPPERHTRLTLDVPQ